jgi:succinate dehydrogenase/fumarate reductase flavoprotein subunit
VSDLDHNFDVIVVGSGASGLTAALVARKAGLRVLVVEKADVLGGTSALSGGWIWVPGNEFARAEGIADSLDDARRYIEADAGAHFDAPRVDAYLANVNEAIRFLEDTGRFEFFLGGIPDYHHPQDGAVIKGRSLCCRPYSSRLMGDHAKSLRPPLKALKFLGIPIASGPELWHFLNATRSMKSATFVAKVIARDLLDRLIHGSSTRLVNGNSLVARLVMACADSGVEVWTSSAALGLVTDGQPGRVSGLRVRRAGGEIELSAAHGVILAAGGFPHDVERRRRVYRHQPGENDHLSMAPRGNAGDGLALAESVGGRVIEDYATPAAWFPVSPVKLSDGSEGRFIHFLDRGKPGVIAVTQDGERFVDEGCFYGDFVEALIGTADGAERRSAWLIADRKAVDRYGLGIVKPWPMPRRGHLRSGYLKQGHTVAELATAIGVPAQALERSVARFNDLARRGIDEDFRRGEGSISRYNGDLSNGKHPSLAPLESGPFYAVQVFPGDIGTFAGIATDARARVVDGGGSAIPGLYAVGNDQASVFGGAYPGAGATLGPAITFGFIAGQDIAANPVAKERTLTENQA